MECGGKSSCQTQVDRSAAHGHMAGVSRKQIGSYGATSLEARTLIDEQVSAIINPSMCFSRMEPSFSKRTFNFGRAIMINEPHERAETVERREPTIQTGLRHGVT